MPTKSKVAWPNVLGYYGWHSTEEFPIFALKKFKYLVKNNTICRVASFPLNFFGKNYNNSTAGISGGTTTEYRPQGNGFTILAPEVGWGSTCASAYSHMTWGRTWHWDSRLIWDWDLEDVTKMEGYLFGPQIKGGGEDDQRIHQLQRGCQTHLNCPEWAQAGEVFSYEDRTLIGQDPIVRRVGYENPETFYGVNQVHMTSGVVDKVGDLVHSGQASGRRILSHTGASQTIYTIDGVDRSGIDYVIDTAPGRSENILQPYLPDWKRKFPDNMFNMDPYGVMGASSFFTNITWYPRYDPYDTYRNVLLEIENDVDFYNKGLIKKYCFSKETSQGEKKNYTWIPHLARATGFIGGYLWHTIKHLGSPSRDALGDIITQPIDGRRDFNIRHSYRDMGVNLDGVDPKYEYESGKDGIGNFLNFTGEEANICVEPGENLTTTVQHAYPFVYTGHGFSGTGGGTDLIGGTPAYTWSRENFESGHFANILEDITNIGNMPEGKLAPSTKIFDTIVRLFERVEPTDIYSGKNYFPVCQDPLIARPAGLKITHNPTFRGTAHAALFIEPVNADNTSWDFDFTGFQMGDGRVGVHSGRGTNNLNPTGNLTYTADR